MTRASAATDAIRRPRRRARPSQDAAVELRQASRALESAALAVADWCQSCDHDDGTRCQKMAALVVAAARWRKAKEATNGPAR